MFGNFTKTENRKTALNLITGLLTVIINFGISFFLSPFIVRHLGAEANGFSQLANNFVMYASLITISFNSMAARFVAYSYHQNKIEEANKYYSSIFIVNEIVSCILLPIAILIVIYLENIINIDNSDTTDVKILFACVFLNFFVNLTMSLFSMAMYVKNAMYYMNILNVFRTFFNALLLFVVFNIFPIYIFYVSAVAVLISLFLLPIYINLRNKLLPEIKLNVKNFSFKHIKDLFSSGIWNTVNQCGHLFNTGLDLLLANWFINPFYMGVLAISKTIPSAIIHLSTTINNNFVPSIIKTWAEGDRTKILKELNVGIKISTIVVSIPIMVFCCFCYDFYSLWQPTLDPKILAILSVLSCLAFIPFAGTQTLYNVFTASNNLKYNSVTFLIAGVINVIIVYVGLVCFPDYGIYILAAASPIITIARNIILLLPYTSKILGVKWCYYYKDILFTLLCCASTLIIALVISQILTINGWIGLFIKLALTIIFAIIADCIILLNKEELNFIKRKIKLSK